MGREHGREELRIRRLKPSRDRKPLVRLARSLPEWFDREDVEEIAWDLVDEPGLVAELGGCRVGFITFSEPASEPSEGRFEITWLAVAREHHRQGVGRALLCAAESQILSEGGRELLVWTVWDGAPVPSYVQTRKFYRDNGFEDLFVDHENLEYWKYARLFLLKRLS